MYKTKEKKRQEENFQSTRFSFSVILLLLLVLYGHCSPVCMACCSTILVYSYTQHKRKIEWIYIAARFRFASFSLTIFVYPCELRVCICFTSLHFIFLSFLQSLFFVYAHKHLTTPYDIYAFICTANSFYYGRLSSFLLSLFFFLQLQKFV